MSKNKKVTIVFLVVVQKLLTDLNVLTLLYGSFFLFVCLSRNDYYSDQWGTFTFDSLVKWIDHNQVGEECILRR